MLSRLKGSVASTLAAARAEAATPSSSAAATAAAARGSDDDDREGGDHVSVSTGSTRSSDDEYDDSSEDETLRARTPELSARSKGEGPPDERLIKFGIFRGYPHADTCSGEVSICLKGRDLWLRVANLECGGNQSGDTLFLYTHISTTPTVVKDPDEEGARVHIPGTDQGGVEHAMPKLIMIPLDEIRYGGQDGEPVHWQSLKSLYICRPGLKLSIPGGDVPTTVYGYCDLSNVPLQDHDVTLPPETKEALDKLHEGMSAELLAPAERSLMADKSWNELGEMAKSVMGQMGKDWKSKATVSFTEFKIVLNFLSVRSTEARAWLWFQAADADGTGSLDWKELQLLLRIVQLLKHPLRLLPRDVYFLFDTEEKTKRTRFNLGKVDVLAFVEILRGYGIRIATTEAEKLFSAMDVRGELRITYRQFFDALALVFDPHLELTKRMINPSNLPEQYDGMTPAEIAKEIVREEEQAMIREVQDAVIQASKERRDLRQSKEAEDKKAWIKRQMETRRLKRKTAMKERAAKLAAKREAAEREAARLADESMRSNVDRERRRAERALRQQEIEDAKQRELEEAMKRQRLGLDRITLDGQGLSYLPAALWVDLQSLSLLPHVLSLTASRNGIERLPVDCLFVRMNSLRKLDVSENRLVDLPPDLGDVRTLQILNVAGNDLRELPSQLTRLERLQVLDLSRNGIEQVPVTASGMPELKFLQLHQNRLTVLPDDFFEPRVSTSPVQLTRLTLHHNRLKFLPPSLSFCTRLTRLDLSWNILHRLCGGFGSLASLTELDISHNALVELPDDLGGCIALQKLDVSFNKLRLLPDSLHKLGRLVTLRANDNVLEALPTEIGDCESLVDLSIRNNRIEVIPRSLGRLTELQVFDAQSNRLVVLPMDLAGCRSLRHMDMSHNQLGDKGLDPIPSTFPSMGSLVLLDLSHNRIQHLGSAIGMHTKLAALNLGWNKLDSVPVSLLQLTTLVELSLNDNHLGAVPDTACTAWPRLRTLDLGNNVLHSLPQEVQLLTGLRHLNLYNNQLDTLPLNLSFHFPRLESFDVARNPLREFPRKVPGQRIPGYRALSVRFRPDKPEADYVVQLHREVTAKRTKDEMLEAEISRDVYEREWIAMGAEDERAHGWRRARVNADLIHWVPRGATRLRTATTLRVESLTDPFDRATHSLATWFEGVTGALPAAVPSTRPMTSSTKAPLALEDARPVTAQAGLQRPAAETTVTVDTLRSSMKRERVVNATDTHVSVRFSDALPVVEDDAADDEEEEGAVARAHRADDEEEDDDGAKDDYELKHLAAWASGPPKFRFGTGILDRVHLDAPGKPLDVMEEAERRHYQLIHQRPPQVEFRDSSLPRGGNRVASFSAEAAPSTPSAASRHVRREGYGRLGTEVFDKLRQVRKERVETPGKLAPASNESAHAEEIPSSDSTWLPATQGLIASAKAISEREIRRADAQGMDHNEAVDLSKNFLRDSVFSRGYSNSDVAEFICLHNMFYNEALEEWLTFGARYMLKVQSIEDFRSAVRGRCGRRWNAMIRPLVDLFFVQSLMTGVPISFASHPPEEYDALRSLRRQGREAVESNKDEVAKAIERKMLDVQALYHVEHDELKQRIVVQNAQAAAVHRRRAAADAAKFRRQAFRAQSRVEANRVALFRVKRLEHLKHVRGLQRTVMNKIRMMERASE
jgi:leucine-rich repeat protein SHOC2